MGVTPKQVRYVDTSLPWVVEFLNLRGDNEVDAFLRAAWREEDKNVALDLQQKFIDLIDLALRGKSPEGLVWSLNSYVADNSESFDRLRNHGPVRAHWYARAIQNVAFLDAGRQAVLKMGKSKWVVEPAHLMPGLEGQLWLCIAQALETGRFAEVRRCQLGNCRRFFITKDGRQRFCKTAHRKKVYDKEAAKQRVYEFRKRAKAKKSGTEFPPKTQPELPAVMTEDQRFGECIELVETKPALAKQKYGIPTIRKWFGEDARWALVPEKTREKFRQLLWE